MAIHLFVHAHPGLTQCKEHSVLYVCKTLNVKYVLNVGVIAGHLTCRSPIHLHIASLGPPKVHTAGNHISSCSRGSSIPLHHPRKAGITSSLLLKRHSERSHPLFDSMLWQQLLGHIPPLAIVWCMTPASCARALCLRYSCSSQYPAQVSGVDSTLITIHEDPGSSPPGRPGIFSLEF